MRNFVEAQSGTFFILEKFSNGTFCLTIGVNTAIGMSIPLTASMLVELKKALVEMLDPNKRVFIRIPDVFGRGIDLNVIRATSNPIWVKIREQEKATHKVRRFFYLLSSDVYEILKVIKKYTPENIAIVEITDCAECPFSGEAEPTARKGETGWHLRCYKLQNTLFSKYGEFTVPSACPFLRGGD